MNLPFIGLLENKNELSIQLKKSFDIDLLKNDLNQLSKLTWELENNWEKGEIHHEGGWTAAMLYTRNGDLNESTPGPGLGIYKPTKLLGKTKYIKKILDELDFPYSCVRLSKLMAGQRILKHNDNPISSFQFGILRLHIPIITHEKVEFFIGGKRVFWQPGNFYYGDFSCNHWINNFSPVDRIHLIIDTEINEQVLKLFPTDFVKKQMSWGICFPKPKYNIKKFELKKFESEFICPKEFSIIFKDLSKKSKMKIQLKNNDLLFYINENPKFKLIAISKSKFHFAGGPSSTYIEFKPDENILIFQLIISKIGVVQLKINTENSGSELMIQSFYKSFFMNHLFRLLIRMFKMYYSLNQV